jgi:hypothetical protein
MSSHGVVRVMDRLLSIVLVALLAGPSLAAGGPGSRRPRQTASAEDAGMDASRRPADSAAMSASPTVAAPVAAAARVVFVEGSPDAGGRPAGRRLRAPTVPRSTPTILRI